MNHIKIYFYSQYLHDKVFFITLPMENKDLK